MDKIIRATAADGFVKMAVADARGTVERARAIHACSPTAAAALGRTLCAASLLGDAMKEEKTSLTIRSNGGRTIGSVAAVSDSDDVYLTAVRGLLPAGMLLDGRNVNWTETDGLRTLACAVELLPMGGEKRLEWREHRLTAVTEDIWS